MATLTVYANENDGYNRCYAATYSAARTGAGASKSQDATSTFIITGQTYGSSQYEVYQSYFEYNTSGLGSSVTVTSVVERLTAMVIPSLGDKIEEVRAFNWSAPISDEDYISGANLASYTLLSTKTLSATGVVDFPSSANFIAAINKTGLTKTMHHSARSRAGNTPTGNEYAQYYSANQTGTTNDPRLVIDYTDPPILGAVVISGAGDISAKSYDAFLNFLSEPQATVRAPVATHVTVKSPTHSYTANITPEPTEATKIERIINIDTGNAAVCQAIAEELIGRWGRTQKSVTGTIPLDVRLKFKEKLHIKYPQAGIDESLTLQRKQHDVFGGTTSIVCGDIILDDNELIARMLQDLINK